LSINFSQLSLVFASDSSAFFIVFVFQQAAINENRVDTDEEMELNDDVDVVDQQNPQSVRPFASF